jgi:spermidine synthase
MAANSVDKLRLYVTCFCSGMVILIFEVLGFRLFAPYYGYTIYVSGTLIGIILGCLSFGYYVGGSFADKRPESKYVYYIIFAATVYIIGVYLLYHVILKTFQPLGIINGTIASCLVIYAVPMALLSMVSPYLIKLLSSGENVGVSSGSIFSISTVGSITGTFLATYYLIPFWGTNKTMLFCIVLLVIISALGLMKVKSKVKIVNGLILLTLFVPQYTYADPFIIHETESVYNLIRVYDKSGYRYMTLNNPKWRQSYRPDINTPAFYSYREFLNLAPFITDVENALVLGMSAGASVVELNDYFGIKIDAVEIDPEVVRIADEYFDVKETDDVKIFAEDARNYMMDTDKIYDFVEIDLFTGEGEIPFYVSTKEFFTDIYDHVSDEGIVMMNVIGSVFDENSNQAVMAIANTFAAVYPSVYLFDYNGNVILTATKNETTLDEIVLALALVSDSVLQEFAYRMAEDIVEYEFDSERMVFTDDKAPVAYLMQQARKKH